MLLIIEINPKHSGYRFKDSEDDFGALVKRTACIRKKGMGQYVDAEEDVNQPYTYLKDVGLREKLQDPGVLRAF